MTMRLQFRDRELQDPEAIAKIEDAMRSIRYLWDDSRAHDAFRVPYSKGEPSYRGRLSVSGHYTPKSRNVMPPPMDMLSPEQFVELFEYTDDDNPATGVLARTQGISILWWYWIDSLSYLDFQTNRILADMKVGVDAWYSPFLDANLRMRSGGSPITPEEQYERARTYMENAGRSLIATIGSRDVRQRFNSAGQRFQFPERVMINYAHRRVGEYFTYILKTMLNIKIDLEYTEIL